MAPTWSSCAWVMTRPSKSLRFFSMKAGIGQDQIDARHVGAGEGDAAIDHDVFAFSCRFRNHRARRSCRFRQDRQAVRKRFLQIQRPLFCCSFWRYFMRIAPDRGSHRLLRSSLLRHPSFQQHPPLRVNATKTPVEGCAAPHDADGAIDAASAFQPGRADRAQNFRRAPIHPAIDDMVRQRREQAPRGRRTRAPMLFRLAVG